MRRKKLTRRQIDARSRGSVYVLVLGASLIVAAIGISAVLAARVQLRTTQDSADRTETRQLARSAIDMGLFTVQRNPDTWRKVFSSGTIPTDMPLGSGTITLTATDSVDGDFLNNDTDPVVLLGTGTIGQAQYMLEVTINGDGTVAPGTWKRVVSDDGLAVHQVKEDLLEVKQVQVQ
jgi:hypothetical protein